MRAALLVAALLVGVTAFAAPPHRAYEVTAERPQLPGTARFSDYTRMPPRWSKRAPAPTAPPSQPGAPPEPRGQR